jgi:hypothetical protein
MLQGKAIFYVAFAGVFLLSCPLTSFSRPVKYRAHYINPNLDFFLPPTRRVILSTPFVLKYNSRDLDTVFSKALFHAKTRKTSRGKLRDPRILIVNVALKRELFISRDRKFFFKGAEVPIPKPLVNRIIRDMEKKLHWRFIANR